MNKTPAQRIKALRWHYRLSVRNFANGCLVSDVTIFKLEKGANMSEKTLLKISGTYGTTREWLLYGWGDMLPEGEKELPFDEMEKKNYWKEKAFEQLEKRGALMEKEIEKIWQVLNQAISQGTISNSQNQPLNDQQSANH